jgi:hypothetical protein
MRIMLLQGDEPFWGRVRSYLVGVNASVVGLRSPEQVSSLGDRGASLLVTGREFAADPIVRGQRMPVVVIEDDEGGGMPPVAEGDRAPIVLRWPFPKRTFLETTAAALHLEPRKEFRAMMRVGVLGEGPVTMAESRDFSSSGMSFTSLGHFGPGARLAISLSPPGDEGSLVLEGRVVRTFREPDGRATRHGVQFADLDPATSERLRSFILS